MPRRPVRYLLLLLITMSAISGVAWAWFRPQPSDFRCKGFFPSDLWTWSFDLPSDRNPDGGICLVMRTSSTDLPPKTRPSFPIVSRAIPAVEAEDEFVVGTIGTTTSVPDSGKVAIHFLDLADFDLADSEPGKNIRILATLAIGGGNMVESFSNSGRDAEPGLDTSLPQGRIVGRSMPSHGTWVDDELYLMSFYLQDDRTSTRFDVVLAYDEKALD